MIRTTSAAGGGLRWHALPDWEPLLFGPNGLRLGAWKDAACLEVLKKGRHRTVYRVRLPDRTVYVKHRCAARPADVVSHLFRPSDARREWLKAAELSRRGIATVKPVAWQERTCFGLVWESFLVTEAIEPSCSLEEFFQRRLDELPPSSRRHVWLQVIEELARFTAAIHRAGVAHPDFHSGNVLLGTGNLTAKGGADDARAIYLIDVPGVRFEKHGPLAWAASRESLAMLHSGWWERTSRSQRLRFWQTYLRHRPELETPAEQTALRQIDLSTRRHARRIARRRDRRSLATNRDFTARSALDVKAHAVADLDQADLARLLHDPEELLWRNLAHPVKLGHTSIAVRAELRLGGQPLPVLYKRYRPRNAWRAFWGRFQRSRAVRSWCGGHALWLRKIPTARPLIVCQRHSAAAVADGYLATEWIEGAENLHQYARRLAELPASRRLRRAAAAAERLGALIGRMHAWGVAHGDLKAANLLVVEKEPAPVAYVIDTDDVRAFRRLGLRRQSRDLARLATGIEAHPWIGRTLLARFFRAYRRQFPPGQVDWKCLWRAAWKRSRRESRRKRSRGRPVL